MIKKTGNFLRQQCQLIMSHRHQAMLCAVTMALTPYTVFLALSLIALITLRRGERDGAWILLVAMVAHWLISLFAMTSLQACVNTTITFVPVFLSAVVLRRTVSWSAVGGIIFVQIILASLVLHWVLPEFITGQFLYIKQLMLDMQPDSVMLDFMNNKKGIDPVVLANCFFGAQALGVASSAIFALILARSVQSRLYYPGEFKREMSSFRGDKLGLIVLLIMFIASQQGNVIAMNGLPILICYFMLAGLGVSFHALRKIKSWSVWLLLITPLIFLPYVMLPVYSLLGCLDTLFNFRLYLSSDMGRAT